jgi:hypothetical protein
MRLVESPRGDVRGRRLSGPSGRRTTKACQRFGKTGTGMQRNTPSSVGSRLKHILRRAEVFTDRSGARVSLRLPRTAG